MESLTLLRSGRGSSINPVARASPPVDNVEEPEIRNRMMAISDLPHLLATINALTILALVGGFLSIRGGNRERHMAFMKGALVLAVAFLAVYGYYKANSGFAKFGGEGIVRPIYFSILIAHVGLAAVSLFTIPVTAYRALTGRFDKHKKIARWTLPVWLIVAVSGIVVYVMAVHIYPTPGQS